MDVVLVHGGGGVRGARSCPQDMLMAYDQVCISEAEAVTMSLPPGFHDVHPDEGLVADAYLDYLNGDSDVLVGVSRALLSLGASYELVDSLMDDVDGRSLALNVPCDALHVIVADPTVQTMVLDGYVDSLRARLRSIVLFMQRSRYTRLRRALHSICGHCNLVHRCDGFRGCFDACLDGAAHAASASAKRDTLARRLRSLLLCMQHMRRCATARALELRRRFKFEWNGCGTPFKWRRTCAKPAVSVPSRDDDVHEDSFALLGFSSSVANLPSMVNAFLGPQKSDASALVCVDSGCFPQGIYSRRSAFAELRTTGLPSVQGVFGSQRAAGVGTIVFWMPAIKLATGERSWYCVKLDDQILMPSVPQDLYAPQAAFVQCGIRHYLEPPFSCLLLPSGWVAPLTTLDGNGCFLHVVYSSLSSPPPLSAFPVGLPQSVTLAWTQLFRMCLHLPSPGVLSPAPLPGAQLVAVGNSTLTNVTLSDRELHLWRVMGFPFDKQWKWSCRHSTGHSVSSPSTVHMFTELSVLPARMRALPFSGTRTFARMLWASSCSWMGMRVWSSRILTATKVILACLMITHRLGA